jgi:hypothetical protein
MKIKTLAIAAATLAVGAISSQAQVYSQNIVGYINQAVPANHYQIVGTQLITGSDALQTNGDLSSEYGNGCISSAIGNPIGGTNTQLLAWSGTSYVTLYYYNAADADTAFPAGAPHNTAGFYSAGGTRTAIKQNNTHACFIHNVAAIPLTNTCTGVVYQGTNVLGVATIKAGYNLICLPAAVASSATNFVIDASGNQVPYGLPITLTSSPSSPPTTVSNDRILIWSGTSFVTEYFYTGSDADTAFPPGAPHKAAGFYSAGGTAMAAGAYPPVNQGFFLWHNGSTIQWTNSWVPGN